MTIRSLNDGEQDACLDLWDRAFQGTPRVFFEKYFKDTAWTPQDTVVCEEDGKLVSAVQTVRRVVETREGRKHMAGIANVGTDPEHRGKGLSTACLEETNRRLNADSWFDFGLLGTGIHDFYARVGWQRWEFNGWEAPNPYLGAQFFTWHSRQAKAEDLPAIQVWYEQTNANQPITVVRDEAYWKQWLNWKPDEYLVTSDGYARVRQRDGVPVVVELGGNFPLHEAMGTAAPTVRVFLPGVTLKDGTPLPVRGWMTLTVQGKPLPDLTDAIFYDTDGF